MKHQPHSSFDSANAALRVASFGRRALLRSLGLAGAAALLSRSASVLSAAPSQSAAPSGASGRAAPSLAGAQPGFYRFKIGALEAIALIDGGMAPSLANCPFGVGEPREKLAEVLSEACLPTDVVRLPFAVLLVRIGDERIMIDAGCGGVFGPVGGRLPSQLAAAGVRPEQITSILISHMHGDHFGGLLDAESGAPAFPNAKLFIGRAEHAFWSAPNPAGVNAQTLQGVRKYLDAFKGRWQLVAGGDTLFPGLEIIDAPGHTPGHLAVQFTSGNEGLLHFVDVVHHHALSFAHPEWVMAYDSQPEKAIETRRRVLDRAAADRLRVFGAHMPFPALGRVKRVGSHFAYVPEPWISS